MNKEQQIQIENFIRESQGIEVAVLDKDSSFDFKCHACGRCCTNSTIESIVLRAYDIYNLSVALKTEASTVVDLYGNVYLGPTSGIPVIQLKSKPIESPESLLHFFKTGKPMTVCPFLKNNKCSVHNNKPGSCRLYPLGRLVQKSSSKSDSDEKTETIYFLQKETICGGTGEKHTIDEWMGGASKTEAIFETDSNFLGFLTTTINLSKLLDLVMEKEDYSVFKPILFNFYDNFKFYYYINYDNSKPFEVQFKKNIECIKEELKKLIESIKSISSDNYIYSDIDSVLTEK